MCPCWCGEWLAAAAVGALGPAFLCAVLAFGCLAAVRWGGAVVLTRSILLYAFDTSSLWLDAEAIPEIDEAMPASAAACAAHISFGAELRIDTSKVPKSRYVLRIVMSSLAGSVRIQESTLQRFSSTIETGAREKSSIRTFMISYKNR